MPIALRPPGWSWFWPQRELVRVLAVALGTFVSSAATWGLSVWFTWTMARQRVVCVDGKPYSPDEELALIVGLGMIVLGGGALIVVMARALPLYRRLVLMTGSTALILGALALPEGVIALDLVHPC